MSSKFDYTRSTLDMPAPVHQEVTVRVRNSKEVEAFLAALRQSEELGEIDFPFDVEVEEVPG